MPMPVHVHALTLGLPQAVHPQQLPGREAIREDPA